jgi:hypothetical protein
LNSSKLFILAAAVVSIATAAFGQSPSPTATSSASTATQPVPQPLPSEKSAEVVSRVQALFAATGWSRATSPADLVLSGTLTRHFPDGDVSSPFQMKLRGESQFDFVEGGTHVVVNGAAGSVQDGSGKKRRMPAQSALSGGTWVLAASSLLLDWNLPTVDVQVTGRKSIAGEDCVGLAFTRKPQPAAGDAFAGLRRRDMPLTIWVSATSGLPLQADYSRIAADNHTAKLHESAQFSDYRNVNGVLLPFRQEILIEGQRTYTYDFTSVQVNQGLTDADFAVSTTTSTSSAGVQ